MAPHSIASFAPQKIDFVAHIRPPNQFNHVQTALVHICNAFGAK